MIRKTTIFLIIILLISINTYAFGNSNIEIFSIEKASVIKNVESNFLIQNEVKGFLNSITGIYGKLNPIPQKGLMVKLFLDPSVLIQSKFINYYVEEVILVLPENETPYLMVFYNKNIAQFYYFNGKIDKLLKLL